MSEDKKYSILSSKDIEDGLKNERFHKQDISLIRDLEGKIVRHMPLTNSENSIIPPTLIQIHSTYIYQADIRPIIDAIIETKNVELFQDLSEKHQVVIDSLSYYKDHNSRLDELNSKSLEACSIFDKRVENYLKEININDLDKIDIKNCIGMLDSYLNMIFIYLLSAYWLHKSSASNDTIGKKKVNELEIRVRRVYEQLLSESRIEKGTNIIPMHNSLYARYLLEEENGIEKIERLIKHDSRFSSITDFMVFIKRCFFEKRNSYYNHDRQCKVPAIVQIPIEFENNRNFEKKQSFSSELFNVLEKIEALKNIHSEIVEVGKIDFNTIEMYVDTDQKNSLRLSDIPLSLHHGDKPNF
jgi:hypothetical protein